MDCLERNLSQMKEDLFFSSCGEPYLRLLSLCNDKSNWEEIENMIWLNRRSFDKKY
jgi:hypothetical protein